MPDNKNKRGTPDNKRIDVKDPNELRYWAQSLHVPKEQVVDLVRQQIRFDVDLLGDLLDVRVVIGRAELVDAVRGCLRDLLGGRGGVAGGHLDGHAVGVEPVMRCTMANSSASEG